MLNQIIEIFSTSPAKSSFGMTPAIKLATRMPYQKKPWLAKRKILQPVFLTQPKYDVCNFEIEKQSEKVVNDRDLFTIYCTICCVLVNVVYFCIKIMQLCIISLLK